MGGREEDKDKEIEAAVLAGIFCFLVFSLNLLIAVARVAMQPRPKYIKPDPLFRSYHAGQNWNWDFCMVFKVHEPGEVVSDYVQQYSLRKIVERLEAGGLETKLFKSYQYDKIFMKIRCSLRRLKDQAAAEGYACRLNPEEVKSRIERGYRDEFGKFRWYPRRKEWSLPEKPTIKFNTEINDASTSYRYNEYIFGKYDKRPDLQSVYVRYLPSNSIFRGVDRMKLIMGIMESDLKRDGCSLKLRELVIKGAVLAVYPLHDDDELLCIQSNWLTFSTPPWNQPIELVKDYFGEKVGMYFLFLGTYTSWLFAAGTVGIITYALSIFRGTAADDYATAIMAIFMSLWATLFLETWKKTQSRAKMQWGMTGFEATEQNRPDFEGKSIHSPITGMSEMYFPDSEKWRRVLCSYLQVALCMSYVAVMNAAVFYVNAYLTRWPIVNIIAENTPAGWGDTTSLTILTYLVLAVIIQTTNALFLPFARYTNNQENHRTETQYENSLIVKVFVFQFLNSYGALFYVAIGESTLIEGITSQQSWKMQRFRCEPFCLQNVGYLLATIFMTRVILGNFTEVVYPYLRTLFKKEHDNDPNDQDEFELPFDDDKMRKRQVSPAEVQFERDDYDYLLGTFDDYVELVIQFGYATLFVSAFPLAPLFACVNNFIEIRTDGWKLCQNTRRPWPMGAEDIGTWEDILTIISIIATVTNGIMVTWTSPTLIEYSTFQRLVVFILLEYVLVGAKVFLIFSMDTVPPDVAIQIERQEFLGSKIIDNDKDEKKDTDDEQHLTIDRIVVHQSDPDVVDTQEPTSPTSSERKEGEHPSSPGAANNIDV